MLKEHNLLVLCGWNKNSFCAASNITYSGGLLTSKDAVYSKGYAFLRAVNSGEHNFRWGRISLSCTLPRNTVINTYVRCSNSTEFGTGDFDTYMSAFSADGMVGHAREGFAHACPPGMPISVLTDKEDGIFKLVGSSDDFYVNLFGRYIWLCFEFVSGGSGSENTRAAPTLSAVRIHMGGDHMIDYLPAVYQKNGEDFTRRFLSVFDSVFMDMEQSIDELPSLFDFENTTPDMLHYLADWVCADTDYDDDALVDYIRTAASDYDDMYTVRGIKRSVKRLTGAEPFIIESINVDPNRPDCADSELYRRLYGWNPFRFFIMLEDNCFRKRADTERFLKKMNELIPAHTEFELILLKRSIQLDCHSYLGVNSFVGNYVPAVIDENTSIYYDTTIGGTPT